MLVAKENTESSVWVCVSFADGSQNKLIREKGHDLYLSALLCFVERFFNFVFFFRS